MAISAAAPPASLAPAATAVPRHSATVRVTHWITALCFFTLLLSGIEILISHPRFYWGEDGNVNMTPLFSLPIPASRGSVPTGYGYVLPDQNGWSRSLHFQSAWVLAAAGLLYYLSGLFTRHFQKHLIPAGSALKWSTLSAELRSHLRLKPPSGSDGSYNVLQRVAYLGVIFGLVPLMIWTGLAMSPAVASVFPSVVSILGGQQSARTIHFFVTIALVGFLIVHVGMVILAGFTSRMRTMITGRAGAYKERS